MPESPLPRLPMTEAVRDLIAEVTGKPCDISTIPRDTAGLGVDPPYTILYPLWTTFGGPAFHSPHADSTWNYQATGTALRGDQIEVFHDKILRAIVGRDATGEFLHALTVSGMKVIDRDMGAENGSESSSKDTKAGTITHDIRFALTVTPQE